MFFKTPSNLMKSDEGVVPDVVPSDVGAVSGGETGRLLAGQQLNSRVRDCSSRSRIDT